MSDRILATRQLPWICSRCFKRRRLQVEHPLANFNNTHSQSYRFASTAHGEALSSQPPQSGHTRLSNRRLLHIHGPDVVHFLQGLVTANVRPGLTQGIYGAFLNAQGRVLHDVFMYPASHSSIYQQNLPEAWSQKYGNAEGSGWLVDVDADDAHALYKHLKRYKLRSKLDLRLLDDQEFAVFAVWDDTAPWTPHQSTATADSASTTRAQISTVDARAPGMGKRLVLAAGYTGLVEHEFRGESQPLLAYDVRRWLRGVPEGPREIHPGSALPQESNIDFMAGGIDFRKGCYVGQELTIRTHHTGIVRKRILPCILYEKGELAPSSLSFNAAATHLTSKAPAGANIMSAGGRKGRSAGKWLGTGAGNLGLALCRLEMMSDIVLTVGETSRFKASDEFSLSSNAKDHEKEVVQADSVGESDETNPSAGVFIKAFVPDWIRNQIRVKKPNARV